MKTIFLDRDGVISVFTPRDYIKKWEEFSFLPHAIEGLTTLAQNNYRIVVISNQAGVNKGIFSLEDLNNITEKMASILKEKGVKIEKFYYCVHTEEEKCNCRKPQTGLLYKAQAELRGIKFENSFFVGDTEIDIQTGKAAGTKTILVLSGKTKKIEDTYTWDAKPDFIAGNLKEAADIVIREAKNGV